MIVSVYQELEGHKWNFEDRLDVAMYSAQQKRQLGDTPALGYEVWTSHSMYSLFLHQIIRDPSVVVTIVRQPRSRWLSAFVFYDLPRRKGYILDETHSQWSITGVSRTYSVSEVAEEIIESSWLPFQASNFNNLSSIPTVPSQWGFNGMSEEMAGSVYGPLDNISSAAMFANRVRSGQWAGGVRKELVMVLERFDESVVVLGLLLGLSTGDGLNSELLYTSPVNPTKSSWTLSLSQQAQQRLEQLTIADQLLYQACNERLSDVVACIEYSGVEGCFTTPTSLKHSHHEPSRGIMSSLVESHKSSVNLAKVHCGEERSRKVSSPFCESLMLSDRDWNIRMNSQMERRSVIESTSEV
jgi:hypothetical protein